MDATRLGQQVVWTTLDDEVLGAVAGDVLWLDQRQSPGEARCTVAVLAETAAREGRGELIDEEVVLDVVAERLLPDAATVRRAVGERSSGLAAAVLDVDVEVLEVRLAQLAGEVSASAARGGRG